MGSNVFGSRKLNSLYIPENIQRIEEYFFKYTNISKAITVSANNSRYSSIYGVLYNKRCIVLMYCPRDKECVDIMPGTLKIGNYAFYKCHKLQNAVIPEKVCEIGEYAFYENNSLKSITLPKNITSIHEGCFCSCAKIESIILPPNVTEINDHAFENCEDLNNVQLPEDLKSIGSYAFHSCKNLTKIILPLGLSEIKSFAFYDCHKLKELNVPPDCTKINSNAFFLCANLTLYYPEKSDYYILPTARVTCTKEKCKRLYPQKKI